MLLFVFDDDIDIVLREGEMEGAKYIVKFECSQKVIDFELFWYIILKNLNTVFPVFKLLSKKLLKITFVN